MATSDTNPSRKEALEHEALGYIRLGTLVQKSRPEDRAEAVASVLAENIAIDEKIRRIERIDSGPTAETRRSPPPSRPAPQPAPPVAAPSASPPPAPVAAAAQAAPGLSATLRAAASAEAQPRWAKQSLIAAAKRRARIKAEIAPVTFMQFLFRESMEIRRRSKGNHFVNLGLFTVSFEEAYARTYLEHVKRDMVPVLAAALELALREGWRFLRKAEYNRLAALGRLVGELANLDLRHISPRDGQSARRLFPMETAYLPFRAETGSMGQALDALDTVLARLGYPKGQANEAHATVRRVLQNGGPPSCLQDFILATNIVRSRRCLSIADLLRPEKDYLVSLEEYDCNEETQERIDAYVASLVRRLDALTEEGEKTLRLRAFVLRDEEGNVDYSVLSSMYHSAIEGSSSWEKDEENVILLMTGLAESYLAHILPLLGKEGMADGAPVPAAPKPKTGDRPPQVDDQALEYELSLLHNIAGKLRKTLVYMPTLSWTRFLAIRTRSVQATKYEAEGVGLVIEGADVFYRAANRLAELLRSRDGLPASTSLEQEAAEADGAGPSFEYVALRQALSTAASAAYLAALRFREPTIGAAIKNERLGVDQRRDILDEIERLAIPEVFLEVRRKANLGPPVSAGLGRSQEAPA